jgi:hypothetical protein
MNRKNAHFIIHRVNVHLIGETSFVNVMTDSVPLRKTVNTVQYIKIITGNCEYCLFILQLCDFEH